MIRLAIKKFDLNVETVLEHWDKADATREIIANALDEQKLTKTNPVEIFQDNDCWHIKDYGRGLHYKHLTQNEDEEKLQRKDIVIGKFGVGLKDALATFDRRGVKVTICSSHGEFKLIKSSKSDFDDIITLHVEIDDKSPLMTKVGTDVIIEGVTEEEIRKAKQFFVQFSKARKLEDTMFGTVYLKYSNEKAKIYVHGLKVAEEENFMFSYNIKKMTAAMRRALNRERTNVGRTAYSQRVKDILLECKSELVVDKLGNDLKNIEKGTNCDEVLWTDVSIKAVQILNTSGKYFFLSASETDTRSDLRNIAIDSGYKPIYVPLNISQKIVNMSDILGNPIRDLIQVGIEYEESFEYQFVDFVQLTPEERKIFLYLGEMKKIIPPPKRVVEVLISEKIRITEDTEGVWEPATGRIIILRKALETLYRFSKTYFHELAHAESHASDYTRIFENQLCDYIGKLTEALIKNQS